MGSTTGGLMLVVFIFGFVLAVAWVILPFAMIGTKPLLRELIREVRETNILLKAAQQTNKQG